MDDRELIANILAGGMKMEDGLSNFYRENHKLVKVMGKKYGLQDEDLLDAYTDSVISFRDQVVRGNFQQKSKCSTYLFKIFQNKCIDILRKNSTNIIKVEMPAHIQDTNPDIVQRLSTSVKKQYLLDLMDQLNESCKGILLDWNDGYSMAEIASRNGLLNEHVARSRRYACLKQLAALVNKSLLRNEA